MNKKAIRSSRIYITHHGDNYWKFEVDNKEYETGEIEGQVIEELLRRIQALKELV